MLGRPEKTIRERLSKLEIHLKNENPLLVDTIKLFKKLDRVAYKMGLLDNTESYATRISWWPLVSVLGTFSAGKSSFINRFLGCSLQSTGNQAVDDKFTVIPYSSSDSGRVLPGLALDSDPRFPFYQMSKELDKVAAGEGQRIDAYLQMKTANSDKLSGKILIDSPGFDADDQRNSILRLTDYITDLSDLVLVFFDARHPEPGAMQDTLEHLVAKTLQRSDSEKFLFILNQIDTAAREDNLEDVVGAWQRALAYKGLTAGRFYTIYNKDVAVPVEDEFVRKRFEAKCDKDIAAIYERIHQVETARSYRIIGALKNIVNSIENEVIPLLVTAKNQWMRYVLLMDGVMFGCLFLSMILIDDWFDVRRLFDIDFTSELAVSSLKLAFIVAVVLVIHYTSRRVAGQLVVRKMKFSDQADAGMAGNIQKAFLRNTKAMRSIFQLAPAGWSSRSRRVLAGVVASAGGLIQTMNDRYADPSGNDRSKNSSRAEVFSVVGSESKRAGRSPEA
jgi:GTPase SAR1 family protein